MGQDKYELSDKSAGRAIYTFSLISAYRRMGSKPPDDEIAQQLINIACDDENDGSIPVTVAFLVGQYRLATIVRYGESDAAGKARSEATALRHEFQRQLAFVLI